MFQLDPDRVFPEEVATSPEYHDYLVPLCRKICTGATDAEIDEAATNLQRYMAVVVRIYQRLEKDPEAMARFEDDARKERPPEARTSGP